MATEPTLPQTIAERAAALRADAQALLAQIPDDVLILAAEGVLQETSPAAHPGWVALVAAIAAEDHRDNADPDDGPLAPPEEYGAAYADAVLTVQVV